MGWGVGGGGKKTENRVRKDHDAKTTPTTAESNDDRMACCRVQRKNKKQDKKKWRSRRIFARSLLRSHLHFLRGVRGCLEILCLQHCHLVHRALWRAGHGSFLLRELKDKEFDGVVEAFRAGE